MPSLAGPGAASAQKLTDVKAGGVGVRAQESKGEGLNNFNAESLSQSPSPVPPSPVSPYAPSSDETPLPEESACPVLSRGPIAPKIAEGGS